jgi:hypothetical protein
VSRPLGSTPTPASRGFSATTSRSASERRIGTQCLRLLPRHAPCCQPGGPQRPRTRLSAPALAFSCSVQEPQTRLSPSLRRAPLGQYTGTLQARPGSRPAPRFRCHLVVNDASTTTPVTRRSGASSWSPPDASRAPFPCRSPRRSSANAAQGGLTPAPVDRRRKAIHLPSLTQHRDRKVSYMTLLPRS